MKKLIIASLSFLFICTTTIAQESDKQKVKEVGMTLHSLNNFGFTYRIGNQNSVWRFSSLWLNGRHTKSENFGQTNEQRSIGVSVAVGKEYRKSIKEQLEFRYGAELFGSYQENNYTYSNLITPNYTANSQIGTSAGLSFIFGFNYLINSNFLVGLELNPSVSYFRNDYEVNSGDFYEDGIDWGLSQNAAALSIIFRFD